MLSTITRLAFYLLLTGTIALIPHSGNSEESKSNLIACKKIEMIHYSNSSTSKSLNLSDDNNLSESNRSLPLPVPANEPLNKNASESPMKIPSEIDEDIKSSDTSKYGFGKPKPKDKVIPFVCILSFPDDIICSKTLSNDSTSVTDDAVSSETKEIKPIEIIGTLDVLDGAHVKYFTTLPGSAGKPKTTVKIVTGKVSVYERYDWAEHYEELRGQSGHVWYRVDPLESHWIYGMPKFIYAPRKIQP